MQGTLNGRGGTIKAALSSIYRGVGRAIPCLAVVAIHLVVVGLAGGEPRIAALAGGVLILSAVAYWTTTLRVLRSVVRIYVFAGMGILFAGLVLGATYGAFCLIVSAVDDDRAGIWAAMVLLMKAVGIPFVAVIPLLIAGNWCGVFDEAAPLRVSGELPSTEDVQGEALSGLAGQGGGNR